MITRHAQQRAQERGGIDLAKFEQIVKAQGLSLPKNGKIRTEYGTLIIQDGVVVTFLDASMVTA